MDPLDKARELILSLSQPDDATTHIAEFSKLSEAVRIKALENYYNTVGKLASVGDTKAISVMLRVFEHFGDRSHDRMLLHYIAQAEANEGLQEEKENPKNQKNIHDALQIISQAFADADEIDESLGKN